ncbi:cell division protein ZipA [Teredinibacter purpureus]|uniref:cell division protein ZipA n=1 Tax=Teredinibacter purpureus TaxID=2731756 RepID=UPI0005F7BA8D|nr:cell division protein ZipA [Teredinibacter purpureus]
MRDWLTVIIVLLIVGILLDGFRRMRQSRRENLQISKKAKEADRGKVSVSSSEFPRGGARVAGYRDPDHVSSINESLKSTYLAKKTTIGAPNRIPEQVTLNLDEHVPMLMDSVAEDLSEAEQRASGEDEIEHVNEPILGDLKDIDTTVEHEEQPVAEAPSVILENHHEPDHSPVEAEITSASTIDNTADNTKYLQPDKVLIINVMAKPSARFDGDALLAALMEQGMRLGAMDIFHRHVNDDGDGPVLFSLANMVVPGTFSLAQMKSFHTPGVSLFLSLPLEITDEEGKIPNGLSIRAYDNLAATAKALAAALNGELKDKNRSVMTQQTIDYDRELVVEYERKQRLTRA